jgi:PKD repeat protein
MKKNKISIYTAILMIIVSVSCKKEGTYPLTETPPLDFRSYYNGLTVTFANHTKNATGITWDFGDKTSTMIGDSVLHNYSATGNYLISMTGNVGGQAWTMRTVLRVDKPSVVP